MTTLFLMLMMELNSLDDMVGLNETLSFFFFIVFVTSMQFILLNMFIAFISQSYTRVNHELVKEEVSLQDELQKTHWSHIVIQFTHRVTKCCFTKSAEKTVVAKVEKPVKVEREVKEVVEVMEQLKRSGNPFEVPD